MSADSFIDSNVFIYLWDKTDPDKQQQAKTLVENAIEQGNGCISHQVVQETLNTVTRKLAFNQEDTNRLLNRVLLPLWKVMPTSALYQRGIDIHFRYRFSFYDSLIIAAALEYGCRTLYSEDLQHAQQIERLTVKNPFLG
ncbi:TPA: PIN domain-containing protein [Candidatus Micrarchaeota archaeon]|nr:PIN domain-containing protein [Candidatus Micrarchaeota archaeon]